MTREQKENQKAYLSICAIYRDEAPYLREWIEFHRLVGVERFFLYNNGSVDFHREALAPYVEDGVVVVHDLPGLGQQLPAYRHCLEHHRDESRWLAVIDLDEFLFSPTGRPVSELLVDYEQWPGVVVNWSLFGTSGHVTQPPGTVIENYVRRWNRRNGDTAVKSIVNPERVTSCESPHHFSFEGDALPVDENKQPFDFRRNPRTPVPSYSRLRINHYWTKSEEECRKGKLTRVKADAGTLRPWLGLAQTDIDSIPEETILLYLPALREALERVEQRAPLAHSNATSVTR